MRASPAQIKSRSISKKAKWRERCGGCTLHRKQTFIPGARSGFLSRRQLCWIFLGMAKHEKATADTDMTADARLGTQDREAWYMGANMEK